MYLTKTFVELILLLYFSIYECQIINENNNLKPVENVTENSDLIAPVRYKYQSVNTNKFLPNLTNNLDKLRLILDQNHLFDEWISHRKPDKIYIPFNGTKQVDVRIKFLVKMKNYTFKDKKGNKLNLSQNIIDSIQQWLEQESSCPMDYIWSELDNTYWPRWVKKGLCVSVNSCSWPPGMNCKPKNKKELKLLQWNCEEDFDKIKYDNDTNKMEKPRVKRQNKIHSRRNIVKRRKGRGPRKVIPWKIKEIKNQKRILKLREYINGIYCKWKKVSYYVHDFCSCYC